MRQLIWTCCAAIILAIGPMPDSQAACTLSFRAVAVRSKRGKLIGAQIYAQSRPVMSITGRGWKSVAAAQEVATRLNALAEEGLRPSEISIWTERRTRTIMARGQRVITVDRALAAAQGTSRAQLARTWAQRLRALFGGPYLSVAPVLVPVGESRSVLVKGNIAGQLVVRVGAPDLVSAAWDPAARELRLVGRQQGRTELVIEDRENALAVPVRAAKYAAYLTGTVTAGVTGTPAPRHIVAQAVRAAIKTSMSLEPSAWVNVAPSVENLPVLWPGRSAEVPAMVSAAGPEYLVYRARPVVTVRNEPLAPGQAELLMVSNFPERLAGYGLWFEGKIPDARAARLLYHHVNASSSTSDLVVELWNLGQQPAAVHVVAGVAGPSYDECYVGHRAALEYLSNRATSAGWLVPVPPGTAVPVMTQRLPRQAVASGVLELRPVVSADLSLRLYLAPPVEERMPRAITEYAESPLLGQWHYPQPQREVKARYEVGRDWAFVTIGDTPATGLVEGDLLSGSYGVIYEISLELANPTAEPALVALLLEPAGGPARGALLVDGRPVETALLRNTSEGLVARYSLAPGEVRQVRIETMPQGGSNYPVRLVARPA